MTDTFSMAVAIGTVALLLIFILAIWKRIRNRSGSATMMLGSMHNILNEDQQKAAEVIILKEAQQKMVEQDSREPEAPEPLEE
ncbi:hypothetical protein ACFL6T_05605 [Candidatus Zixiibacteriota bacterium]